MSVWRHKLLKYVRSDKVKNALVALAAAAILSALACQDGSLAIEPTGEPVPDVIADTTPVPDSPTSTSVPEQNLISTSVPPTSVPDIEPVPIATETPTPTLQGPASTAAPIVVDPDPVNGISSLTPDWSGVWLCEDSPIESEDLTAGGTQTCLVTTEVVGDNLVITTNGIPNHNFESTLGCCASEQNSVWTIPLTPALSGGDPVTAPDRGPVAFTVSGVAIYGPEEGPGGDAVALEYGYFIEDRQAVDLGVCGGHGGPGGEYHYHYDSNCMHWHSDDQDIAGYGELDLSTAVVSQIIGFAFDGFPIYSTFESNTDGVPSEVRSSYRLRTGEDGYGGIDDYVYVEDLGDLDECNGHSGSTPEAHNEIYHYHSTLTNGDGDLGFPYFPLCYKGVVNEDNYQTTDIGGLGPPPNGGSPPPRP